MSYEVSSFVDRFLERQDKKDKKFITECGSFIQPEYEYKIVDGIKMLVRTGEKNVQDYIDSFEQSTDINYVISRFLAGDTSVMNPYDPQYGDFTHVPKTLAEAHQRVLDAEKFFNGLPKEIKEKFDNSSDKFWTQYDSPYFREVFKDFAPNNEPVPVEVDPIKESEVKDAE